MRAMILALAALALPQTAASETELNFYIGTQTAPHSRVSGIHPDGGSYNALMGWDGKSTAPPPYYGLRATWWKNDSLGFGAEITHAKVYARAAERNALGFQRMEFTDGLNILTLNASYRWKDRWKSVTPYVSGGLGVAVPHVDVLSAGGQKTFGYQVTGPAARLTAGAKYGLTDHWSVFGEYQFTASQNKAKLANGGTLKTRILTNALNFGIGYSF